MVSGDYIKPGEVNPAISWETVGFTGLDKEPESVRPIQVVWNDSSFSQIFMRTW